MKGSGRGGRREGSGRPKIEIKRKQRAIHYFDEEWALIQEKARRLNISPREYIFRLVELDDKKKLIKN